jgi:hypothetical protein
MTSITCDMCKRVIESAVRDENYFTIRDRDLCKPCKKQFDRDFEDELETKMPYSFEMEKNWHWQRIEEATT